MDNVAAELLEIKNEIADYSESITRMEGERVGLIKQLKSNHGVGTKMKAAKLLLELQKKKDKLKKEIDKKRKSIVNEYNL